MYYCFETSVGMFYIVPHEDRWHIMFDDDNLGSYINPIQAADDLAGGHTFSPGRGINTAKLGIPEDIHEWTVVNRPWATVNS